MNKDVVSQPSAVEKLHKSKANFRKYKYLLTELVRKNIKLKYRNSVLGMFWTILQPLLTMIVLTMVFGGFFGKKNSPEVVNYSIYLLTGRLIFDFFTQASKLALRSIRENASIIKKVYVPKYMYPMSSVISNFVNFALSLIVLVAVMAYFLMFSADKPHVTWYVLLIFVPILVLFLLTLGAGLILATLNVFFRDIQYIFDVFTTLLFYLIPIVYPMSMLSHQPKIVTTVIRLNPLYGITEAFRSCVLYGKMWDWNHILYPLLFSVVLIAVGFYFFNKKQDKFILHI